MNNKSNFYFDNFVQCADITLKTAQKLKDIMTESGVNLMGDAVKQIHEIEHEGDSIHHQLITHILKDFITPLEREDIVKLSNSIDDVTDSIEDIVIQVYINNETKIREDCYKFIDVLIRICTAMKDLLIEFPNFRKSTVLNDMIVNIHRIEEECDQLYISSMRKLHTETTSVISILNWRDIYGFFENCCDTCALVADIVEGVIIGNT